MLRSHVRPDQTDWDEHLACAKFVNNKLWQVSIKNSPFFLNYGMHPLTPVSASLPRLEPSIQDFVEGIEEAVRRTKQEVLAAQNRMAQRVNAHCRELAFNPGDLALLSTKNLRQPGPGVRKLKPSYMGPFEVDSIFGNAAVKLELPREWTRIHNVFHVNLVKPYLQGSGDQPSRQRTKPPAPLQFFNGERLFEVEALR